MRSIFDDDFRFTIPDYQRPYSWTRDQAGQLLDDLLTALGERNASSETGDPYFLGSLVLVKKKGRPAAEVIDGQQRLTTLTLLFAVLAHLAESSDEKSSYMKRIQQPGDVVAGTTAEARLKLRARDREFFTKFVQSPDGIGLLVSLPDHQVPDGSVQRRLRDNASLFVEILKTKSSAERLRMGSLLVNETFLVVVSTSTEDSAHRVFSVMNSRGLQLSPADIFKARVIGSIDESMRTEYSTKWEDAEEELGKEPFADLFLHLRTIFVQERAKQSLLKEFQEVLNSQFAGEAGKFVDDVLVPYASAFEQVREASFSGSMHAPRINQKIRQLNRLANNDWVAPALWAICDPQMDESSLLSFLTLLERLAASMLLQRYYATPRASRYVELLKQLAAGRGMQSPALKLSGDELAKCRTELDGEIYRNSAQAKYVLLRLDEDLADASGVSYEHRVVSIEHVLPQTPREGSQWNENFTEHAHGQWLHRLGNLVLLSRSKNSQAQNYDFTEKKSKYFQSTRGTSNFALTSQVLNSVSWTPEVVERRHIDLLNRLVGIWNLGEENAEESDADAHGVLTLFGTGGVHALGRFSGNGHFVVEEAMVRPQVRVSMRNSFKDLRDGLRQKQVLVEEGDLLKLVEPLTFASSSAAAEFVLGYSASGPLMWKAVSGA
ncbi:DUF4357 domain-containing protein [Pseudarthrobacter enclensis]|uniref:DUF4357 domain-containing protein n=1 Tax=Pseudarthrobacter enclensis TaxID=993070 RepID=UPI0034269C7A